jgi:hypothetical protein
MILGFLGVEEGVGADKVGRGRDNDIGDEVVLDVEEAVHAQSSNPCG